jgi:hypothetical protein
MFVQVIQGQVEDPAALRRAVDQWYADVAPGADGWLGSTGGVTDDGRFIALVRFADAAAARRNSERAEQDQWWKETSTLFTTEPTFIDTEDVTVDTPGDPGQATFVQVMQGTGRDPDRAKELMAQNPEAMAAFRPELLGSISAAMDDGTRWTMAIYFTSEADARQGEQKEPPAELRAQMEELGSLMTSEPVFFDLRDPWLHAPA